MSDNDYDLVGTLRVWAENAKQQGVEPVVNGLSEAADEIERLRAELAAERATTAPLLRIIALIREAGGFKRDGLAALPGAVKAMRQQRDEARGQTWYLLYGGTSEDGMGTGHYIGRTTDKEVARNHHAECRKNPYSIGFVEIVTDTEKKRVSYYGTELQPKKKGGGA